MRAAGAGGKQLSGHGSSDNALGSPDSPGVAEGREAAKGACGLGCVWKLWEGAFGDGGSALPRGVSSRGAPSEGEGAAMEGGMGASGIMGDLGSLSRSRASSGTSCCSPFSHVMVYVGRLQSTEIVLRIHRHAGADVVAIPPSMTSLSVQCHIGGCLGFTDAKVTSACCCAIQSGKRIWQTYNPKMHLCCTVGALQHSPVRGV